MRVGFLINPDIVKAAQLWLAPLSLYCSEQRAQVGGASRHSRGLFSMVLMPVSPLRTVCVHSKGVSGMLSAGSPSPWIIPAGRARQPMGAKQTPHVVWGAGSSDPGFETLSGDQPPQLAGSWGAQTTKAPGEPGCVVLVVENLKPLF